MTIPGDNPLAYQGVKAPNPPNLIRATRAPLTTDISHDPGTFWLNEATDTVFVLVDISAGSATWDPFGGGSAGVDTINGLSPAAGNITLAGTASQISLASAGSTVTFSLPAALVAPGSVTATTSLQATTTVSAGTGISSTTGDITATDGNLVLGTAGNKLEIAVGANASAGIATLTGGTATVLTTAVTGSSIILLTRQSIGATGAAPLGLLTVGTVVAGTSFDINAVTESDATALTATDVSVIAWLIIN